MAHQIAVFAENRPGRIERVTRLLEEAGVNIRAITISTSDSFGVIKLLADDPDAAFAALKENGLSAVKLEIIAIVMEDRPGGLHRVTGALSAAGVNIDDAYGFVVEDKKRAVLVIEVGEIAEAVRLLREQGVTMLTDEEIYAL